MRKKPKSLFLIGALALITLALCACNVKFNDNDTGNPDGVPQKTEDEIIECDGYTLTVNGTVLKNVEFTARGTALRIVVPEGITEIGSEAGRMLLNAVSITIPSTLEKFSYTNHVDLNWMYFSYPRVFEIYDLSEKFDFDLENASYSSRLKQNLKVIHKSANEPSVLT